MIDHSTNGNNGNHEHTNGTRGTNGLASGDGLSLFARWLNPEVLSNIRSWKNHPELSVLYNSLASHTNPKTFLDFYAEAMIARQLHNHGIEFHLEVPTPQGTQCDFEIIAGESRCYLHLKRLTANGNMQRSPTISTRLRYLEAIRRPYEVKVRWQEELTETQLQSFVRSASEFIQHGHVGDEYVIRDDSGTELGGLLIQAPWEGPHVRLRIGTPSGFSDEAPRIGKLMQRAARQFMPGEANIVLIGSEDLGHLDDFETALLGSHIERWDRFPPQGERVAHGRDADGFWHGDRYEDCPAAGWFLFDPKGEELRSRLFIRDRADVRGPMTSMLRELFDTAR